MGNYMNVPLPDCLSLDKHPVGMQDRVILRTGDEAHTAIGVSLMGSDFQPDRIVQGLGDELSLVPMWTHGRRHVGHLSAGIGVLSFPPNWGAVLGCEEIIGLNHRVFLNRAHSTFDVLSRASLRFTDASLAAYKGVRKIALPDVQQRSQLLKNPGEGVDWLLACALSENADKLWVALAEQDEDFLSMLWRSLGLESDTPVVFCTGGDRAAVRLLTPGGVTDNLGILRRDFVEKYLPWPPPDWCLTA
jgi:hypothetical protein